MKNTLFSFATRDSEHIVLKLTPEQLGFVPATMWNPSPTRTHRTAPWELPKKLTIGIFGNEDTSAKFSPPPFAVVIAGEERAALVHVVADCGWHLFNNIDFEADSSGVTITIDLEGQNPAGSVAAHVRCSTTPALANESNQALLTRGIAADYPAATAARDRVLPAWWRRPIYCGWGDQVSTSMWLEGVGPEMRANAYCIQGLYERWIRRLDEAGVPFGTIIIDAGWSLAGELIPLTAQWPDLKGFIARQHAAGRKVLLWLATWLSDGLPAEWCVHIDGTRLVADASNPDYRAFLRERVQELISPEGYDADGFKIDQLAYSPSRRRPRGRIYFDKMIDVAPPAGVIELAGPGWGVELLHQLQHDIYSSAKAVKPDCLITSSTVHPYFHDTFDMVRLHDMGAVASDIFEAMTARANIARAALPDKLIDTDDWIHTNYELWQEYTIGSHQIGVPCIFYAEHFMLNWHAEPATRLIPLEDLAKIAAAWSKLDLQA